MGKTRKKAGTSRRRPKAVRIAVIGAGGRAVGAHYPCFAELPGCELAGVCDIDETRLASVCDRFGVSGRYTDFRQMIEVEKPDAVYAFMPPHHLYDVAAEVMERGCHLFIEKPPAVTTEQVHQLAIIAQQQGVQTGVTFQRRYSPLIRQGKARCEARGAVHTAHASFYKNWVGGAPYYKGAMDMLTCD